MMNDAREEDAEGMLRPKPKEQPMPERSGGMGNNSPPPGKEVTERDGRSLCRSVSEDVRGVLCPGFLRAERKQSGRTELTRSVNERERSTGADRGDW